ncbi:MAG: PAS domain S-box protein [Candidatus Riflebacteria bacterium]|nr:PAS domain S-box protein [Candidatus Riflebacteria bacterium]
MSKTNEVIIENNGFAIISGIAVIAVLFMVSRQNFLLFHSLVEIFSIIIAAGIFMLAWNTRKIQENGYLLFLGIAYLFVGGIDLLHTLSYKGMSVFTGHDTDLPTQLWIIARYLESVTLLLAPVFLRHKFKPTIVLSCYTAIVLILLLSVFLWQIFPACFIEGVGLTAFKTISEFIICFILLGAIALLFNRRSEFNRKIFGLIVASIFIKMFAELMFASYMTVYGLINVAGHVFKTLSFYLIYLAIIYSGLKEPFTVLFRKLKKSETEYKSLFEENLSGFALHEIICNADGQPVDYRFLAVNPAFEKLTGLKAKDLVGKTVLEALPATEKYWIEQYGKVALTGESVEFENYSSELDKHYLVLAYRPAENQFACVIQDVTDKRKFGEEREKLVRELQKALEEVKTLHGIIPICAYCKKIRNDKGAWNAVEAYVSEHTHAVFSHGACPDCYEKQMAEIDADEARTDN